MGAFLQDLRYAIRQVTKSPGFTLVAILTLALGIGANTAIFQLIDAVRLRTIPVRDPQTLATIFVNMHDWGMGSFSGDYAQMTFPMWQQISQRQQAFSSAAVWSGEDLNLATGGEADMAKTIWISGEFFRALDVQPLFGRLITPADDQAGCGGGVDISYSFWQRRYGGSASVIGRQLTLEGHPFPILGVTPPGFEGIAIGERFDVAAPICAEPLVHTENSHVSGANARETYWLAAIGRLKPGWNLARATAQLQSITSAVLHETIPPEYDADGVKHYLAYQFEARPAANGFSELRKNTSSPLALLLGLSGVVLLIACANLANLMLARANSREREIAVRRALGASPARLIRQLLSESAMLAIAGTVCGAFLAKTLSGSLVAFMSTPHDPIFLDIPTDWRVLGFAAGLAILTTTLFGLLPALRAAKVPPGSALRSGGRGMTAGRDRFRLQRILVTSQVALSLVLLAGALLFARSLRNLLTLNPGFEENGVLIANVDFTHLHLPSGQRYSFERDLLDRIRALPGVESAASAMRSPLGNWNTNNEVLSNNSNDSRGVAWQDEVSPGYFHAMRIPMLEGRDFDASDTATSPKVAIVNRKFADKFAGGKSAIGQRFRLWTPPGKPVIFYTIVGVVGDSTYRDLHEPFPPITYMPRAQDDEPTAGTVYLIRSRGGLTGTSDAVKDTLASVNPEIDIEFRVLRAQLHESLRQDELMATLCGFFGALAVLLAAIGLYGVISYTISQRTNEIGVRMALGAQRGDVIRMILREVSALIAIGVAAGVAFTLAAGKAAGALLFDLKPRDPVTLALAVILLAAIGFAASFVPARRASRLDPMAALRYE
ncbi:MAG TPA: ABC transporter permease [Verrucomicrobiae bacterium]|nr:ABC transporter permease [Verrucomicrobiae bacterium]